MVESENAFRPKKVWLKTSNKDAAKIGTNIAGYRIDECSMYVCFKSPLANVSLCFISMCYFMLAILHI